MRRWLTLLTLILCGEVVFGLPFQTARFFRPTLLEVFGFTNTQLGDLFAAYGVAAMLSYFPGGALADRFTARSLLATSLLATAAGGLVMMTIPDERTMAILYAYWGVTSIFLFWGALIKATREWGGSTAQGRAFGLLDAGRGLVAAGVAFIALRVFVWNLPGGSAAMTAAERTAGFQNLVLTYTIVTLAVALMAWFLIPVPESNGVARKHPLRGMKRVIGRPVIWAQAGVVVAAYCGFKGIDNYSLYLVQVLDYTEVEAAELSAWGAYIRPAGALAAGLLADRYTATRMVGLSFALMLAAYSVLAAAAPGTTGLSLIFANLFVSYFAASALRGIYFALLEENRTPKSVTGAAVGMVSVIGFTPEIFFAPVTGRILDADPGLVGHQNYFLFLAAVAVVGLLATVSLVALQRRGRLWVEDQTGPSPQEDGS